jgi:hypothetical protein
LCCVVATLSLFEGESLSDATTTWGDCFGVAKRARERLTKVRKQRSESLREVDERGRAVFPSKAEQRKAKGSKEREGKKELPKVGRERVADKKKGRFVEGSEEGPFPLFFEKRRDQKRGRFFFFSPFFASPFVSSTFLNRPLFFF